MRSEAYLYRMMNAPDMGIEVAALARDKGGGHCHALQLPSFIGQEPEGAGLDCKTNGDTFRRKEAIVHS
ncbi:MAG: hypothetical protein EOP04_27390 [Proteobacteria bacterium]|nr:MAG: hypothetical protein EOP04_27390 [Pseudomonadota bacterium]